MAPPRLPPAPTQPQMSPSERREMKGTTPYTAPQVPWFVMQSFKGFRIRHSAMDQHMSIVGRAGAGGMPGLLCPGSNEQ